MPEIKEITVDDLFETPKEEVEEFIDQSEEVTFTENEENEFIDLLQIGKKSKTFRAFGHEFVIETLTTEEEIELGRTLEFFQSMPTATNAFRASVVAAGLRTVDGKPLHQPLGQISVAEDIRRKFNVVKKYYPTIVDYIYGQTLKLTEELRPLWQKLGKELS